MVSNLTASVCVRARCTSSKIGAHMSIIPWAGNYRTHWRCFTQNKEAQTTISDKKASTESYRQISTERWQYTLTGINLFLFRSPGSLKKHAVFTKNSHALHVRNAYTKFCQLNLVRNRLQAHSPQRPKHFSCISVLWQILIKLTTAVINQYKHYLLYVSFKVIQWRANWLKNLVQSCQTGGLRATKLFKM